MERISAKKYGKTLWTLFASSVAVIVAVYAVMLLWKGGEMVYDKYFKESHCYDPGCYYAEYVSDNVYFHDCNDGDGYIFNSQTGKKTVSHVKWIARPDDKDSLVCFSNGKKRGYFSKYTGKIAIEPRYSHAWIFSEGLASVEEDGFIKFIDETGKVVIDNKQAYVPHRDGYLFHGGYCIVSTDDQELYGLMDRTGKMILPMEYSDIEAECDYNLWRIRKGDEAGVLDREMNTVLPMTECFIYIGGGTIDVTMPDHTIRKYDEQGQLINDFYVSSVRTLEYEKDDIVYCHRTHDDDGEEYAVPFVDSYHPKATARLRVYVAGEGYEGLMTNEGHLVTMPLYSDIEAIGYDLYLCNTTNWDKLIVNGRGEIVR